MASAAASMRWAFVLVSFLRVCIVGLLFLFYPE